MKTLSTTRNNKQEYIEQQQQLAKWEICSKKRKNNFISY
jgi:hypothetical protein